MRLSEMYYSYKILFKYNIYYFQLSIYPYCEINNCKCYIGNEDNSIPHFILALYGWIDNISNILLPYNKTIEIFNNIIPDIHWNYK